MKTSLLLVTGLVVLGACHGKDVSSDGPARIADEQDRSGTTRLTSSTDYVGTDTAIDSIVSARCARELGCNNVGADKPLASSDACLAETRRNVQTGYGASECPGGMTRSKLDACLDAIRTERCDHSVAPLSRLDACMTTRVCVK